MSAFGDTEAVVSNDQQEVLRLTDKEIAYWRAEVEKRKEAVVHAEEQLAEAQRKLTTAEAFVDVLRDRYGVTVEPESATRFKGRNLREAALTVIKEKGRATSKDIITELQAGGFSFGAYAARQIHAALIRQNQAIKESGGIWRWKVDDQAPLPLKTEGIPLR